MKTQVICSCGQVFWSKAFKNKLGEVVALRIICKKCENRLRRDAQIDKNRELAEKRGELYIPNPHVKSLEGIDEQNFLLATLAQIERERRAREKRNKEIERKRQRGEICPKV